MCCGFIPYYTYTLVFLLIRNVLKTFRFKSASVFFLVIFMLLVFSNIYDYK